jgi:LysM repeat protein
MPNLSRPALMIGAIAIAAIALFFLPALLGIGGTGSPAGPSLAPSGAAASQSLLPTQVPAPTPVLYTIKKNDILSKIASAHGVSLADLLAANPQIKNPNRITEGQVITIPVPSGGPDQGGGSAQPSPSAS